MRPPGWWCGPTRAGRHSRDALVSDGGGGRHDAELSHQVRHVHVLSLADDLPAASREHSDDGHVDVAPGRRNAHQVAGVRADAGELDDSSVAGGVNLSNIYDAVGK